MEAALLTVEDLGNGWVDTGPTPFEVRGLDECPATNVLTAGKDPGRVGEAQTSFTRGDGAPAPTSFEPVSLWSSEQVAQDRLATFATATATCVGVTQPTPDGDATVRSTERAAPGLGEEAVGQTSRSDFEDRPDATVALIAVRIGGVIVFTNGEQYDGSPRASLDTGELEDLTRRAVDEVERNVPLSQP